ncbi:MAG: hypothetical protein P4L53_01460 [Candidatus Obscuribacterales bacterium]|nr:hypothetical protein [Candidatus Obscuribacterales bacterium]
MTLSIKPLSRWQQLSFDEKVGTAAILIYIMCILNWFSCRYGFGGIDFESEKLKAWVDLSVAVLPFLWLLTAKSNTSQTTDKRALGLLLFSFLFFLSLLNFLLRGTSDQLISEQRVDGRKSIKLFESGGSAIEMPSRYEQAETRLLPGVKWMRVTRTIDWREFIPE